MAVLLMKLRLVPDDELAEIEALLDEHELGYYLTTAGNWGLSLPALWLVDAGQLPRARALLDSYAEQRRERAQALHAALRESGRARTVLDIARENPLRFVVYVALIGALLYVSTAPFLSLI